MKTGWLLPIAALLLQAAPPADRELTDRMHHLRLGDAREWTGFPATAEGPALDLRFEATSNPREHTIRLRHRDVKAAWRVLLNDAEIGRLPADEADTVSYLLVPAGTLKDGTNTLRIDGRGAAPDDVLFGEIALIGRPRADVLSDATVDVAVHEDPGGRAIPSRITVTDEHGALVSLGNETDASHAVRPGVVYGSGGTVRLHLPAGRHVIHASRGFEYGVDRVTVDAARGQSLSRTLSIRREVDTTGWAAMDTHLHTGTFARHGDATIDERMLTLAGEGIELPVSTEHDTRVDFEARARAMDVRQYFTPILGTEVTTPALGHFNVFPMPAAGPGIDPRSPTWTELGTSIAAAADRPLIVLNHGFDDHGGFRPLARHIATAGEDGDGWTLPANAMEILNSGAVMNDALALTRAWMELLNRGRRLTPVGSSDSHDVTRFIVGQGRTYVRCDDRDPGAIDVGRAIDSLRRGHVMVSYGLLTEIEIDGRGPGELVTTHGELAVRIRVKGPGWTRADDVALYVNGARIRHEAIPDGTTPGVKWEGTWRLPAPAHGAHLVAVATGPGVTAAYWPTAKPYQPTSPDFTPYVLGVSGAVFVTGRQESGSPHARKRHRPSGSPEEPGR